MIQYLKYKVPAQYFQKFPWEIEYSTEYFRMSSSIIWILYAFVCRAEKRTKLEWKWEGLLSVNSKIRTDNQMWTCNNEEFLFLQFDTEYPLIHAVAILWCRVATFDISRRTLPSFEGLKQAFENSAFLGNLKRPNSTLFPTVSGGLVTLFSRR